MAVTPLRMKLGEKIRKYLLGSPLRQRDLAAALGVSCSAVSQMISGKIVPQQDQLDIGIFADVLGQADRVGHDSYIFPCPCQFFRK